MGYLRTKNYKTTSTSQGSTRCTQSSASKKILSSNRPCWHIAKIDPVSAFHFLRPWRNISLPIGRNWSGYPLTLTPMPPIKSLEYVTTAGFRIVALRLGGYGIRLWRRACAVSRSCGLSLRRVQLPSRFATCRNPH